MHYSHIYYFLEKYCTIYGYTVDTINPIQGQRFQFKLFKRYKYNGINLNLNLNTIIFFTLWAVDKMKHTPKYLSAFHHL